MRAMASSVAPLRTPIFTLSEFAQWVWDISTDNSFALSWHALVLQNNLRRPLPSRKKLVMNYLKPKVVVNGHVKVPTGGQLKCPTPRTS